MTEHKKNTINNSGSLCVVYDEAYKQGKADARAKTIEEMAQTIRKIEADTSHCLFDCPKADEPITCTICALERAVEQMKGESKNV